MNASVWRVGRRVGWLVIGLVALVVSLPARAESRVSDPPAATQRWSGSIELPGGMGTLDFSVDLTGEGGTIDIPAQGAKGMKLSEVGASAKDLKFTLVIPGAPESANARFSATVAEDGKTATGVLKQSGAEMPLKMKRLAEGEAVPDGPKRPQNPKPPYPYKSEEVSYINKIDGTKLGGTLTLPEGKGPYPAVVMITGSGAQNRDEELLGHKPFLVIADWFTRAGIAVLRVDDRGVGASSGNINTSTSEDFAGDVLAGVAFLVSRPEIDPHHIGLVGHSEGGLIAPMVAAKSKDVAFIVLMAGTGMSGKELLPVQSKLISLSGGMPEAKAEAQAHQLAELLDLIGSGAEDSAIRAKMRVLAEEEVKEGHDGGAPIDEAKLKEQVDSIVDQQTKELTSNWFKYFIKYDPATSLRQVHCPVLAINGSLDTQVPSKDNLPRIEAALRSGGNTDVTVKELAGLNHLFQNAKTGSPTEYQRIEETIAPEALELMTKWIRDKSGLAH